MIKVLVFILSLFVLADGSIEFGNKQPDYGKRFGKIITGASIKLQEVADRRPFKLKKMNDSIKYMAMAAKAMALQKSGISSGSKEEMNSLQQMSLMDHPLSSPSKKRPSGEALDLLRKARSQFSNSMAILFQAVIYNFHGDMEKANYYFEEFLLESKTYSDFDKKIVKSGDFYALRRTVYNLLKSRGITFEDREKDIQMRSRFGQLMQYVRNPAPEDKLMNMVFVGIILGGILLIFLGIVLGIDFTQTVVAIFVILYLGAWISYGLWIGDLAFGLPWGLTRHVAVRYVIGGAAVLVLIELFMHWRDNNRPLEDGYKRCPHCRAVVVALSIECEKCKRKLK